MRPSVYCASKLHRAAYWRAFAEANRTVIEVVSTWHNSLTVEQDDANSNEACRKGWVQNLYDLLDADAIIAWCVDGEKPNGTLVEIGSMIVEGKPVYLVGDFAWGTWRHLLTVKHFDTVDAAVEQLLKDLA